MGRGLLHLQAECGAEITNQAVLVCCLLGGCDPACKSHSCFSIQAFYGAHQIAGEDSASLATSSHRSLCSLDQQPLPRPRPQAGSLL